MISVAACFFGLVRPCSYFSKVRRTRATHGQRQHGTGSTTPATGELLRANEQISQEVEERKGAIARAVHSSSAREDRPMITVYCTGLPASLIESEQRLKRVFHIHFETCAHCHGPVKIIAAIDDPEVSHKILTHLAEKASANPCEHFPERRAPAPALGVICDSAASLSEAAGQGATTPAPQPPMSARAHVQRTEDIRRRPIPAEGLRLVTQRKRKRADHDVGRQIGFGGRGFYTSYTPPKDDPSIELLKSAGHNTTTVRE